jgi:hypothetical protein
MELSCLSHADFFKLNLYADCQCPTLGITVVVTIFLDTFS